MSFFRRNLGWCLAVAGAGAAALLWCKLASPRAASVSPVQGAAAVRSSQPVGGAVSDAKSHLAAGAPASEKRNVFAGFNSWVDRFAAARDAEKASLIAEGERLAKARLEEMRQLIEVDPEEALRLAVPYSVRKRLPASILDELEEPVSGRAKFTPVYYYPLPGREHEVPPTEYHVAIGRADYRASVYGRRVNSTSATGIPLHGIAVGDRMAVSESSVRILDAEESRDVLVAGRVASEPVCPVCGSSSRENGSETLADYGGDYYRLDGPAHGSVFAQQVQAAETAPWAEGVWAFGVGGNPSNPPPVNPSARQGARTVRLVAVRYSDDPNPSTNDDAIRNLARNSNLFFSQGSFGAASLIPIITPIITLPQPRDYYDENFGQLTGHAFAIATAMGYSSGDYNYVIATALPGAKFGGISSGVVFGGGGALNHELGHNFGLGHANFLDSRFSFQNPTQPNPALPFDQDSRVGHDDINAPVVLALTDNDGNIDEYGHPFDTMGTAGGHFNAAFKNSLGWLPEEYTRTIRTSQTNRVHAFDSGRLFPGRILALRFAKHFQRTYWFSLRQQNIGTNIWFANGLELTDGGGLLIDTTPGTAAGRADGAVVVGRTFTDPQADLHVTPIERAGTGTNGYIDVVVNVGPFPSNREPTLSITASALSVPVGSTVTFTANATEPDGDSLAYYWEFGDQTFGSNAPVNSKTFTAAGNYVVTCDASDMKGGVARKFVIVRVGSPNTHLVRGRVIDTLGRPLRGARAHNSITAAAGYRYAFTDSDGNYAIANVANGTYTNRAFAHGYRIVPLNFNDPVTVNDADVSGLDFLATPLPRVSVATATNATENGAPGAFVLTRTGDLSEPLDVRVQLGGDTSSVQPLGSNMITFEANASTTNILVIPQNDTTGTGPKSVSLLVHLATSYSRTYQLLVTNMGNIELTNVTSNYAIPGWEPRPFTDNDPRILWFSTHPTYIQGTAQAAMTVNDDDPPGTPSVVISAADNVAVETRGDYAVVVFTRTGGSSATNLVINCSFTGVASNGFDYAFLPGQVTIPAGQRSVRLPIIPIDDQFVEGNETLSVNLLPGPGYTGSGNITCTIVDDDLPLVNVVPTDSTAAKTGGNNGVFTFIRHGSIDFDLPVNYLVSGTAISGVDYQPLSGTVLIPAGQLSATVTLVPINSPVTGASKTVTVLVSDSTTYNTLAPNSATVTILENFPTVTLATTDAAASEAGDPGQFTITRTGPTGSPLTVFFTVGGTATEVGDYAAIGTNVIIPADSLTATIDINPRQDLFKEFNDEFRNETGSPGQLINSSRDDEHETVIVRLLPGTNYNLGGAIGGTVTITDDDGATTALPAIGFMLPESDVREDAGSVLVHYRISANPETNFPVLMVWRVTSGTGVNGVHYSTNGMTNGVTFRHYIIDPNNSFFELTAQIKTLSIPILNDNAEAGDRTFTLTFFPPTGIYVTNVVGSNTVVSPVPTNAFLGDHRSHTITIRDVGITTVSIAIESGRNRGFEGGSSAAFRVTRTGSTNSALTVPIATSGTATEGSDYIPLGGSITIPAGTNSVLVPIVPIDDPTEEPAETVTVRLLLGNGYRLGTSAATVTLVDNDGAIQFSLANYTVNEGATNAIINVLRTGDTNAHVTVDYAITDGSATNGFDYFATNGTLVFPSGECVMPIVIPLVDDLDVEGPETVHLVLLNSSGGSPLGGQRNAVLTIVDNDVSFEFASATFPAYENATNALVTVRRLGVASGPASVVLTTGGGTATAGVDYTAFSNVLNFAAGETSKVVAISLTNDVSFEGDETVDLALGNSSPGATVGALSNAVLVIVDDEASVEIGASAYSTIEYAGFVQVELRRNGGTRHPLTVGIRGINGTATNGTDYSQGSGTVNFLGDRSVVLTNGSGQTVFLPGESTKLINIPILDDALGEDNETFQVAVTNVIGPAGLPAGTILLGAQTNTTVTIIDDEQPGFVDFPYFPVIGLGGATNPTGGARTTLTGTVRSATTGQGLPGVTISAGGSVGTSDPSGDFVITNVPVGSVSVDANLPGFIPFSATFTLLNQPANNIEFAMSPVITGEGTIRLVLTWGQDPSDLDSHLDTPDIEGTNYHVYFGFPGFLGIAPYAALDVDDVTGFGPETITITNRFPGTYSYYIHRFFGSGSIASSGARVQVYSDAGLVGTVNAPTNGVGDYWHVLQIDGETGGLTIINGIGTNVPTVLSNLAPTITTQPQSQLVDAGASAVFSVVAGGSGPLGYQWRRGGVGLPGETNAALVLSSVTTNDSGVYSVVVTNSAGSVTSSNATLVVNVACTTGVSGGLVYALAINTNDSKVLVGGSFTTVNGLVLRRIARLKTDGQTDNSFNPGIGASSNVYAIAVQPDNRVLIGGSFTNVDGTNRTRVARLTVDGNLDPSFTVGAGANADVRAIAAQPDGRVLVGGEFTAFNGDTNLARLVRLNPDGTVDTNFAAVVDGPVFAIAVQPDGGIVVGGCFTTVGGTPRGRIARLTAAGSNDPAFVVGSGADGAVRTLALQADGKILAGGAFVNFNGAPAGFLRRLNSNGSVDATFQSGTGADAPVNAIAVAPKGKIYVAGSFNNFNGQARRGFLRLLDTGVTDNIFHNGSGPDGPVYAAVAQPDSALVIGGNFTEVHGLPRTGIARVHGDEKSIIVEVEFTRASFTVLENAGPAVVTLTRIGRTNSALAVTVATSNLSAIAGVDYAGGNYTANFASNQVAASISIPITNNATINGNRSFRVALTNAGVGVRFTGITNAIVTIEDDEQAIQFGAGAYGVVERFAAAVTVLRIGTTNGTSSALLVTTNGTATPGADYAGVTNLLVFAPGESSKTVLIPAFEDDTVELPETVELRLLNISNALAGSPIIATLTINDFVPLPGGVDIGFDSSTGASDLVRSVAAQPDGRLVIGGAFTNYDGATRNHLARLLTNGTLDASFDPGLGPDGLVASIGVLGDGRLYIGGAFSNVNNSAFNRLGRLLPGGLPDYSFNGPGTIDSAINALSVLPDGRVVTAGAFTAPRSGAARLTASGTFDLSFTNFAGASGPVNATAVDAEGRTYLAGSFTSVGGFPAACVARLLADGSVDTNFVPPAISNGILFAVVAQPDGRVVIGGEFADVGGTPRSRIARLLGDGSHDATFDPGAGANGTVFGLALQGNGRLIAGGAFTSFNGAAAGRYVRLEPGGAVDTNFNVGGIGADGPVYGVALAPDGKVVLGGDFHLVNGLGRRGVAMLYGGDAPQVRLLSQTARPGGFEVKFNTVLGTAYAIDATADLVSWTPLATNVAFGTAFLYTDGNFPLNPVRVYRIRLLVP